MHVTPISSTRDQTNKQASFSTPLDSRKEARLMITSGISNFNLSGDSPELDLFQAEFTGLVPEVRTTKGVVSIRYRMSLAEWVRHTLLWNRHSARLSLNSEILWEIDLHGGISNMKADLKTLKLKSLAFRGGVSQADIALPRPSGTVPVYLMGGSSRLSFSYMQGVGVRLSVSGGASQLAFSEQYFDSFGGRLELETPGYEKTTDRYDIRVYSGAHQLKIHTQEE